MSFFGFDTSLPQQRGQRQQQQQPQQQQQQQNQSRFATNDNTSFGHGFPAQDEEEDLATFTWGEGASTNLLEGGDEYNDETFGDVGDVGRDYQWSAPATNASKPKGPIASTKSRYGAKAVHDPFAASEDDFYSSRHDKPKKAAAPKVKAAPAPVAVRQQQPQAPVRQQQPQAPVRQPQGPPSSSMSQPMWGAAPRSAVRPPPPPAGRPGPPSMGQIRSLEEIEAEMTAMDFQDARGPTAPPNLPTQPQIRSLEEIEREMMRDDEPVSHKQPSREETPVQLGLASSGYAKQQALLDNLFPLPGQGQPQPMGQPPGFPGQGEPGQQGQGIDNEQRAREYHAKQQRIAAKIQAMSTYNNCMGSSDKDFITRIQLSQLATADPYTSDFYAQVYTAVQKQRQRGPEEIDGPAVVKVGQDAGFGVGGASGNRFGQMGNKTMQKLSSQVKKLVEQRKNKQMSNDALQGALGRVSRTSVAAPKPVLAVPTAKTAIRMPQLNQQAGVHRQALTRKQALVAIEGLYDQILELEQARMQMPPQDDIPRLEAWNMACLAKSDEIWRRLMVMEPLDVSQPHPFVSLLNPIKGQKLFFRLQRHLQPQQAITLLTLLTATYPQLDVVARAPPPPVADASILSKVERKERAKREAETDNFLQFVVPGLDRIITEQCGLSLINGLFGICFQRMEVWRVASTRPGVALFTALLSKAQLLVRSGTEASPADLDHWNKTFAYLLSILLPHLPGLFPSSAAQKAAFGPGAYLVGNGVERLNHDMERREAEVWGLAAALAVNAPDDEQTNLVGALRETILHTVQSARNSSTPPQQAEMKLRNVNMFLNGLGLDAAMIE